MGTSKAELIQAVADNHAVTIGTAINYGLLFGGHAYAVTAYDSGTDSFTLYNPWGRFNDSTPYTQMWAQISWSDLYVAYSDFATTYRIGGLNDPLAGESATDRKLAAPPRFSQSQLALFERNLWTKAVDSAFDDEESLFNRLSM